MDQDSDDPIPVARFEDATRRNGVMMCAEAGRVQFSLAQYVELDSGIVQMEEAFHQGQVDMLTNTSLLTVVQRGAHGGQPVHTGILIGNINANIRW